MGDAFRGSVGAMGGAEGVVDVDVGQRGEGLGEGRIVGFFFGVVTQVFKQQYLAGLELAGKVGGDFADAVRGEGYVDLCAEGFVEQLAKTVSYRAERVLGIRFALGTAEMRGRMTLALCWRA